jgi:signal transduction histidine kinase
VADNRLTFSPALKRMIDGMSRLRHVLWGTILATLLVFGAIADYALLEQARLARQAALAEADEKARLTAASVRAALAEVEQDVLAGKKSSGVTIGRLANPSALSGPSLLYRERPAYELEVLVSSESLSGSALPEAVVAAIALGRSDVKTQVAERLLSGQLPVLPDDLPQLTRALGMENDPRLRPLQDSLRRAPDVTDLPLAPAFRRTLTETGVLEGWSRTHEDEIRFFEVPVSALLDRAGVSNRASLNRTMRTHDGAAAVRIVAVPDVDEFRLMVAVDSPGQLRIRALRVVLWLAVVASLLALVALARAVGREARAVSREKAFLASVTHELRTPLATIRLFGETLAEGRGSPREYGALVAEESKRLDSLIERVLAVTRVDEAPVFSRVEPAELVDSAVNLIDARAEQRAVQIDWQSSSPQQVLPEVWWDAEAVRRALLNLLDNAIKHGKHGGRVKVRAALDDGLVKLSVTDDGPGIGRRDRQRVFKRFQRGESESAGTGLGLYVVEQVAHAHGGRVDLVTEENRGCAFTLVLPVVPPGATSLRTNEESQA